MIDDTLFMMLIVGLIVAFAILAIFIWGSKTGQFDDSDKMMDGLLFDSTEDLNDAINRESRKNTLIKDKDKDKKKS